jgi:acyl-CoA thioester hydrolase
MDHLTTLRVRYGETDPQGVVYHARFLDYFEVARTEWLRAHGFAYRDLEARGFLLVVTETDCRYRGNARYDDVLRIATRVPSVSPVRIRFAYTVTVDGGPPLVEGGTTLACVNAAGRPQRLPREVLEALRNPARP